MPVRTAGTGWLHDDHKIQREFERKDRFINDLANRLGVLETGARGGAAVATQPDSFKPPTKTAAYGIVYVNQLPLPGSGTPEYAYQHQNYTPDYGFYGWAVHKMVHHNLNLQDKNRFLINLIDLRRIDTLDLDEAEAILHEGIHHGWNQDGHLYIEPYNTNSILLWGVYKPDLYRYTGTVLTPSLYYIDEPNLVIRTNLVFYYSIERVS